MQLYNFQEYPVVVGNEKSNLALCVVWQDTERIIKYYPQFKEHFSIIGNLRSVFGINVILYNLALNPHIRRLIIWAPDKLSNTPIGLSGKNALIRLWRQGVGNLVEEIPPQICETIRRNVDLSDLSDKTDLDTLSFDSLPPNPYMSPTRLPEIKVKTPEVLPSERYGFFIRAAKGSDGYLSLLHHIWKYGRKTRISDESEEVREIRGVSITVTSEQINKIELAPWLLKTKELTISQKNLDAYYQTQFTAAPYLKEIFPGVTFFEKPRDYSYMYAQLIYAYPRPTEVEKSIMYLLKRSNYREIRKYLLLLTARPKSEVDPLILQIEAARLSKRKKIQILIEALIPAIDQVAYVIDRIKRKKEDLDKEIILWDVRKDTYLENGRPCLIKLSFSVRDDLIDVHAYARSHDVGRAWFFNYYGIAKLLGNICRATDTKTGTITIESESAHVYKRDWSMVKRIIEKQIDTALPRMYFDPNQDADPRGVLTIEVVRQKIKLKLKDFKTGNLLWEKDGQSARELAYLLKHLTFISRIDHGIFIGQELAKAEICMKLGIEYKYDNPIRLSRTQTIMS